ncbi:NAD(P)/FAD-dependent oxidoreductase [Heyndrickxia coagulans]|uniref:NAD(P)/FAD-dependent oxidoreductase n=1 Tax=Heyndrickxia coagulans TaxID=1398 RepID=UPI0007796222|nr:NAD(P)/FAD-dependent oxidoreductase [Heyndrickxia coagulans]
MALDHEIYDVTIIGGGPIGLFTAFYSGMRKLKTKVLESSGQLGGKISMFYPEKTLRDIGGIRKITGGDLVKELIGQAETFSPTILFHQHVSGLKRRPDGILMLSTENGGLHLTKTVILTVGAGIFKPIKLDIPGAERYESGNLHYAVDDLNRFRNKRVLISGGGNAAVDWANELAGIAESITIVHRREAFSGHEYDVSEMVKNARLFIPYCISALHGTGNRIERVAVKHAGTGEEIWLEADEVVVNHGIQGDYGGILNWGLKMKDERIEVNGAMETNIPGIFAAGDAATYPHKLKLIAGGFAEGPVALNSAVRYMCPDAEPMAMYSTHHEDFADENGREKETQAR